MITHTPDGELRFFAAFPSRAFLLRPKSETGKALALLGSMVEMLAPAAMAVLRNLDVELNTYPNTYSDGLRSALAELYGLEADNFIIGNGSDEMKLSASSP